MAALGEILRKRREQLGFTLAQAEEETKIRALYLQALEDEDFGVLPARVYATGFVRRYARFLGLNEEEAVQWFKQLAYGDEEEAFIALPAAKGAPALALSWPTVLAALLFLLLAIALGSWLAGYLGRQAQERSSVDSAAPHAAVVPSAGAPAGTAGVPAKENEQAGQGAETVAVRLQADERCWVAVSVDGRAAYSGTMQKGAVLNFEGRQVAVTLGNAGGVRVSVDQRELGRLGASGQVVRRVFTAGAGGDATAP
ncbi:MAG: DUF4115 domain-containing protein [Syntrophomonadaceae bacterium]|jgi:cytoskeletal protein RodZ|nr:DUF4115 domain-containing protein [Syntrophomonadaceae bacterium]MDH7497411.1 DUF4115 domain-containing protein [Syntrophomonadaceae bacterium]